jgi:hypothetical protein
MKRILGIVKDEGKGNVQDAKKILTTRDVVTPARKPDVSKPVEAITTRDTKRAK